MAVAGPPLLLQRALAALVTPIGRLRGYKGRYEEYLTRGPSEIVELEPLPSQLRPNPPISTGPE
jgi:hypothetical protein